MPVFEANLKLKNTPVTTHNGRCEWISFFPVYFCPVYDVIDFTNLETFLLFVFKGVFYEMNFF